MTAVTALLTNKAYGYPTRGARRRRKPTILACLHQTANAKATAMAERTYANRAGSAGARVRTWLACSEKREKPGRASDCRARVLAGSPASEVLFPQRAKWPSNRHQWVWRADRPPTKEDDGGATVDAVEDPLAIVGQNGEVANGVFLKRDLSPVAHSGRFNSLSRHHHPASSFCPQQLKEAPCERLVKVRSPASEARIGAGGEDLDRRLILGWSGLIGAN